MISNSPNLFDLEQSITQWRQFVLRRSAIVSDDADELESHLRDQIDAFMAQGLHADEAFLIATKRIGNLEAVSHEFAEVHTGRLWQNLVFNQQEASWSKDVLIALGFAVVAALLFQLPRLLGFNPEQHEWVYARNISLFCLPVLAGYWVVKRQLDSRAWWLIVATVGVFAIAMNAFPWQRISDTGDLAVLHLPIVLWFLVGVMYTGNWWQTDARRMDFIRFSGEYAIYFVLIALGGGVLTALTIGLFAFIGFDIEFFAQQWLIPSGAMGAVVIVGWLVDMKKGAVENMAPVLARIFTPLFTLLLISFLAVLLVSGRAFDMQRDVLIGLDAMLIIVLGLVLYSVSSREPSAPAGLFDTLQLLLVLSALSINLVALSAMSDRIFAMGITPNRLAALGENCILLISLSGYAWYYFGLIRGAHGFAPLERWQTRMVPVYVAWAAVVVLVLPIVFSFG
ncbi:permease prefix domain 1-containing protein [Pseudidiomarina woesei]|uniref:DUF4153 domain-containing protein n=1 Tax=Pseudidiomarina woesei TaxID=1381080 RepID=A0A0K6HD22_9GAMM|nr:permease prefix domain 1-containing protein [Pseudidiomarina woesei]CUA88733.1 hypothetical protein Ga0061064_2312 [Pseudidiomarina woesei]